jgi:hypothetical protein
MSEEETASVGGVGEALVVEALGKWTDRNGMGEGPGRVVGALMGYRSGQSDGAIARIAGVDVATAARVANALVRMGVADRRTDGTTVWRDDAWSSRLASGPRRTSELRGIVDGLRPHATGVLAERLAETADFCAFMEGELPGMVARWVAHTRGGGCGCG